MTKNIFSFNDFKGKKSIKESINEPVNEMVEAIDDVYRVGFDVDIPKSLISSFIKKVKESTGKDLRAEMGEKRLAERLVQWAFENYMNIENLPVEIVTGTDKSPVQAQSQVQSQPQEEAPVDTQSQPQAQPAQAQPAQAQAQPAAQVQATPQTGQAQKPAVQGQAQSQAQGKSQKAASQIPAQEI
jgi:hypothetical protein